MKRDSVRVVGDKELAESVAQIIWTRLKFLDVNKDTFTVSAVKRYPAKQGPDNERIYFTVSKP